jgi:VWFA-related protein
MMRIVKMNGKRSLSLALIISLLFLAVLPVIDAAGQEQRQRRVSQPQNPQKAEETPAQNQNDVIRMKARDKNADRVISGVMSISPTKEPTAFFDSVVEAAHYLDNTAETGTRRVVVVISDGEDTLSERYKRIDALRELQRTDCLFYSINPSGPSIRLNVIRAAGQQGMASLAAATGGSAFVPDKIEDLDAVFRQIANELQAQYLLGYYSTDERMDGGFRRISVRIAKRADLRVRARQGYYAPKA